ncbi:MAG: GHKL domain-containing protein [Deltaproteobacteria bacterium]|nr:GHKL domain-containing protein [Deltaproteobacteria bacterium]
MIPSALSHFVVSLLIFSLSISVPLRARQKAGGTFFSLLALGGAFLYFMLGIRLQYPMVGTAALSHTAVNAFFIIFIWYFGFLLTGSKRFPVGGIVYILITSLSLPISLLPVFLKQGFLIRIIPWITLLHGITAFYNVLNRIYRLRNRTENYAIIRGLEYLGFSTLIFGGGLFFTFITGINSKVTFYGLNILSFTWFYFLGQNVVYNRLMDFNEALVKIALQTGLVIAISGIYLILLLSFPYDPEILVITVLIASFITVLLLEPIEKFTARWIAKTIFWNRERFREVIDDITLQLDMLPESESAVYEIISNSFAQSVKVGSVDIVTFDDDKIQMRTIKNIDAGEMKSWPVSNHSELLERLNYTRYVSVDEIEQEFDRLKEATALSLGGQDLNAILDSLHTLKADVVFPVFPDDVLAGFLSIRIKEPFYRFSEFELSLLLNLAGKIGATFGNIQKYVRAREKERLVVLGQMSAGLAHEIKNPLGAIKGALQILEEDLQEVTAPSSMEFVSIISEEVDRLTAVVNTFLDYARPGTDDFEPVRPVMIIKRVLELYERTQQTIDFSVDCETQCDEKILGNADKLRQVFINLLENSIEAVSETEKPTISISCSVITVHGKKIMELIFSDNGIPIPQENIITIFQPFFTTKTRGTGLGLSICRKIVQSHKGDIHLSSGGKEFTIHFPVFQE